MLIIEHQKEGLGMQNILIIGATGSLGRVVRATFLKKTTAHLTLFSRSSDRLDLELSREQAIAGSVLNQAELTAALTGQDVVFVALSGNLKQMSQAIVQVMQQVHGKRLLFVSSMGIYNEIPATVGTAGNLEHNPVLQPYRDAADIIEASALNYTIIRPGWFDNQHDVDYEVTVKGTPFGGHDVSRTSIADLVVRLAQDASLYSRESIGINRPIK
jgi:uncharacterized protein YbjT (DUF2867 family)